MKLPPVQLGAITGSSSRSPGKSTRRCLLAAALFSTGISYGIETEFIGPEEPPEEGIGYLWSNNDYWSNGIPGPGDTVLVQTRNDINDEPILFPHGPLLDVSATVLGATLGDFTSINNAQDQPNNSNLFVTGTTVLGTNSSVVNFAGTFSLGTLDATNFNTTTKTLESGPAYYLGDREGTGMGITEFRNADIVHNKAVIAIYGTNCFFRDQNTGLNAFRNFASNEGVIFFNDGFGVVTPGNFTNSGQIYLNLQRLAQGSSPPALQVSGNLVNNGSIELYPNSRLTVAGGLSGTGSIRILGLPVTCAVSGVWDVNGGLVNLGGSGIDSFTLKATNLNATNGAVIEGNGTIEAIVTITAGTVRPGNSAGQIAIDGDLTLETGATLEMEIGGSAHDKIIQGGGTAGTGLGGILTLSTIDDFDDKVLYSSTYEILSSDLPLTGSFTNVASGGRVATLGGKGSFRVDYGTGSAAPNKIILSDYQANIVPKSFSQWLEEQEVDSFESGAEDDPNEDGIVNLEAYFRGIPALGGVKPLPISATVSEGNLIVSISAPKWVDGVNVSSVVDTDFQTPAAGPDPTVIDATPTRDIYQVTVPATGPKKFVRFVIQEIGVGS